MKISAAPAPGRPDARPDFRPLMSGGPISSSTTSQLFFEPAIGFFAGARLGDDLDVVGGGKELLSGSHHGVVVRYEQSLSLSFLRLLSVAIGSRGMHSVSRVPDLVRCVSQNEPPRLFARSRMPITLKASRGRMSQAKPLPLSTSPHHQHRSGQVAPA